MKKKIGVLVLVAMVLAATSCGGRRTRGVASTGARQVREHWSTAVQLENQLEAQYRKIMTDVSAGYRTLQLDKQLADDCFENYQEVLRAAMEGRYGENVEAGSRPDGSFDEEAFINAFAVNEAYPEAEICQQMLRDLAAEVKAWNQDKADNFGVFWDMVRQYDDHIRDDIVKSMTTDFLQWAAAKAEEAGLGRVPQYVYPTFNLSVETRDQEICDYYALADVRGECSWNPVLDSGKLTGQGAYDYMTRLFVAPEVSEAFDSGEDTLDPFGE